MKSNIFEITVTGKYLALELPQEIVLPFLEKEIKRVKVIATFKGKEISFHAAIQKRLGNYYMMFSKRYQKELGVFPNDYFQLQFFEDTSKYGVDMPEEFEAVLQSDYEAHALFEQLTAGKKRSLIYAILSSKNQQKRIDRSLIICENLKRGIRDNLELLKSF